MLRDFTSHRILLLLGIVILFTVGCNKGPREQESILATSDFGTVSVQDFHQRYDHYLHETGIPDNFEARRSLLRRMQREILLEGAYAEEIKPANETELRATLDDLLVQAVATEIIRPQIRVSRQAIEKRFRLEQSYYHIRQIFTETESDARLVSRQLKEGMDFKTVAAGFTAPDPLGSNMNDLGYVKGTELKSQVLRRLVDLRPDSCTEPFRVQTGYTVIQLLDVRSSPLPTRNEFARRKKDIIQDLRGERLAEAASRYVHEYLSNQDLRWNDRAIDDLHRYLQLHPFPRMEEPELERLSASGLLPGEVLVESKDGAFLVQDLLSWGARTTHAIPDSLVDRSDVEDFVRGLIARRHLVNIAEENNLDEGGEIQSAVSREKHRYKIDAIKNAILDTVQIPVRTLKSYYDENRGDFRQPEMVNVREIVVGGNETATNLLDSIRAGVPMGALAQRHTLRKSVRHLGGELGFATRRQYGQFGHRIFAAAPGEVIGPLKYHGQYVLFQVLAKRSDSLPLFGEVRSQVRQQYIQDYRAELIEEVVKKLSGQYGGEIYWEKLTEVQYQSESRRAQL